MIVFEISSCSSGVRRAHDQGITESMAALTITTALVAPLRLEGELRGLLYLDFRDALKEIVPDDVEFLRGTAGLVSVVLELSGRLQVAREEVRQAKVKDAGAPMLPSLDELLWPPSMAAMRREIDSALFGESSILILGESGCGKTALARAIAEASGRHPIVRGVLGSADDLNTITSELFGHERGAFSGAVARRVGLVELAKNGTLILDEILNLPRHAQQLLLDFTQFGTYRPLGFEGAEPRRVKVRLIAATNGDLDAAIADGRFRNDLYYRLAAITLRLPPLRERRQEIPLLAENFLRRVDPAREWQLTVPLRRLLMSELPWPGNVRQLEALLVRATERARAADPTTERLGPEHFDPKELGGSPRPMVPDPTPTPMPTEDVGDLGGSWQKLLEQRGVLDERERQIITAALTRYGGVVTRAARELNVPRTSLLSRIQTLGIDVKR
jgi:transcriptional regulator with GAF, ATPase, and Fis domain